MYRRLVRWFKPVAERINVAFRGVPLVCRPHGDPAGRLSPYDSLRFRVGTGEALICYSRPSANGRTIFGGLVPFGELWRAGANEPTILHLPFDAVIGGVRIKRGSFSLYTIPGPADWQFIINASTSQWGLTSDQRGAAGRLFTNQYTAAVAAREVARVVAGIEAINHAERFTIRSEVIDEHRTDILFEWEKTRARLTITAPPAN